MLLITCLSQHAYANTYHAPYYPEERIPFYAATVSNAIKRILTEQLNGDISNLHKVILQPRKRWSFAYYKDKHLQVFHPKGGKLRWNGNKINEVTTKKSKIVFTLGNQINAANKEYFQRLLENNNLQESDLPKGTLAIVVTHVQKEVCDAIAKRWNILPIKKKPNLTPFPATVTEDNLVHLDAGHPCLQDDEGVFYYVTELLNYRYMMFEEYKDVLTKMTPEYKY